MKFEVPIRINVEEPLAGVAMQVQRGRSELVAPAAASTERLRFEFTVQVDTSGDRPNFLGAFAQGPKNERFIYVNSGTYAGQVHTCWSRRAKISLISITAEQIESVLADHGCVLETSFPGTGRDGGPTCASVKGIEWKVVKK